MQIESINNNTISKTWYLNFARPVSVYYNHCVINMPIQFAFNTFLYVLDL